MNTYTIQIQFDEREGEYYIPLPEEMLKTLADLGWSVNDELEWVDNQDGTFLLKKKYDTITNNAEVFRKAYGLSVANALASASRCVISSAVKGRSVTSPVAQFTSIAVATSDIVFLLSSLLSIAIMNF